MSSGRQLLEQVEQAAAEREAQLAEGRLRDQHQGTSSWWSDLDATVTEHATEPGPLTPNMMWLSDPEAMTVGVPDEGYPHLREAELAAVREKYPEFVIQAPDDATHVATPGVDTRPNP